MLFNDEGEKLYFEVCYSSQVSGDKIKSGIPIIELHANDEKTIDRIIRDGEIKHDREPHSYRKRPVRKSPQTKIYNKEKLLLLHGDSFFDCFGECIVDIQLKKYPKKQNHSLPKQTIKSESAPERVPREDLKAISYLLRFKNDAYTKENIIPSILKSCKKYYIDQHKRYRNNKAESEVPIVLDEQNTKIFVSYQRKFYGIVRYEAYWHIFDYENNKLIFISSKQDKDSILDGIKNIADVF